MTPLAFLDHLQEMERGFGRPLKTVLNEPRPLDLDIIIWGDQTLVTDRLVIPHPRAHTRRFVLQPMAEIVPNYTWPGSRHTVAELLASLDDSEVLERVPEWPSSGIA
jgi:7,8-dihydro-6-hydroxymethylpterin-pyrophosphokinase